MEDWHLVNLEYVIKVTIFQIYKYIKNIDLKKKNYAGTTTRKLFWKVFNLNVN